MSSQFPTAALRLAELFSSPFAFSIPLYQRPYSWDVRQAAQLFTDLTNAAGLEPAGEGCPYHFFGTILLLQPPGEPAVKTEPEREFDVIDGQQRLITVSILLSVLRDLDETGVSAGRIGKLLNQIPRVGTPGGHRVQLRSADQDFLERHVLLPGACSEMPREDLTPAQKCMLGVREYFVAELTDLSLEDRLRLLDYLVRDCHFVVIQSNDMDLAYRLFTTINERGKKLARNDILKADVLSALKGFEATAAARLWDETSVDLGADFEVFFSHLKSAYGHSKPQIVAAVRAILAEEGGPAAFMSRVFVPMSSAYSNIRGAGSSSCALPADIRRPLIYLNRLRDGDWAPAAMLTLRLYGEQPETAARLLGEIDRLAHVYRFLCIGSGKRQTRFAAVIRALRSGRAADTADVFTISRDETRLIVHHLKDLHRRNQMMCRLLLARLDEVMAGQEPSGRMEDVTTEHVLPVRPGTTSEWRRIIPDPAEREVSTESLGNLLLIPSAINDKARNLAFARKKEIYIAAAEGRPLSSLTQTVVAQERWGKDEIAARERVLLELIAQVFRLDFELPPAKKKRAFWNFAPTA